MDMYPFNKRGGGIATFSIFFFCMGGSYNFCEGHRNLCNVGFFCAIFFLKLFSKFHPGLVSDRFKKSLHSKNPSLANQTIKYFISGSLSFHISCFVLCNFVFLFLFTEHSY